ncbi:MAG: hypothetical protein JSV54_02030, partial [Chloroflexota bacterium]
VSNAKFVKTNLLRGVDMNGTLAPKSLGDILSETFSIYKKNFLRFAAIVAIVAVPFAVLGAVVNLLFPAYGEGATDAMSMAMIKIPFYLAFVVAFILMTGAIIHAMAEQYFNQPVNIARAYKFAWHRLRDMFWAMVLYCLAIGGIFATAILMSIIVYLIIAPTIGGISDRLIAFTISGTMIFLAAPAAVYLGIIWNFVVQTALLEGCGPTAALSRSWALVKGSWWRVLGIVLLLSTIMTIIYMILDTPTIMETITQFTSGAITGPPTWVMIWRPIGVLIGNIIGFTIYTIGETLLYFDLRVRKEGYSLDALADELGLPSTTTDAVA